MSINNNSRTVTPENFIKIKALREALDTHPILTDQDKKYFLELTQNALKASNIDFDKYIYFILYTNQENNIGRWCLSYNDFLDKSIQNHDDKTLSFLVTDFKENVFFELYDNKYLDEIEKNAIKQTLNTEFLLTKLVIQTAIQNENLSSKLLTEEFRKEYSKSLGYEYFGIPKVIYTAQSGDITSITIHNYMDLIQQLSLNQIKDLALESKYEKEIKLYKRYLKTKSVTK